MANPDGDADSDGLSNWEEAFDVGTNPNAPDTDGDGVKDGADGWALEPFLTVPRQPTTSYVVISLEKFGAPLSSRVMGIDDAGDILINDDANSNERCYTYNVITGATREIPFSAVSISLNGYVAGFKWSNADIPPPANPTPCFMNVGTGAVTNLPHPSYSSYPNGAVSSFASATNGSVTLGSTQFVGHDYDSSSTLPYTIWHGDGPLLWPENAYFHADLSTETYTSSGISNQYNPGKNKDFSPSLVNSDGIIAAVGGSGTTKSMFIDGGASSIVEGEVKSLADKPVSAGVGTALVPLPTGLESWAVIFHREGNGWTRTILNHWASNRGPYGQLIPLEQPVAINSKGDVIDSVEGRVYRNGKEAYVYNSPDYNGVGLNNYGLIVFNGSSSWNAYPNLLVPCDIAVDANRDGVIKFAGNYNSTAANLVSKPTDKTSEAKPFRFWLNSDTDDNTVTTPEKDAEKVPATTPDYTLNQIKTKRDLEDFSLLALNFGAFYDKIADGTFRIGLKWKGTTTAKIKVYRSANVNGINVDGTSYLNDDGQASAQVAGIYANAIGEVSGSQPLMLPPDVWTGYSETDAKRFLLFEGSAEGKGELEMVIQKADGTPMGEGGSVWLDLVNVRKMYRRVKATGIAANFAEPSQTSPGNPPEPSMSWVEDPNGNPYDENAKVSWQETKDYIVFVHGWNMSYEGSENYGETIFKRLWQKGYKGRYAFMRWETLDDSFGIGSFQIPYTYNASEYRAWKSGESLKQFVASLPGGYTKNLIAHSMGNVVCGSALQKGMAVDNYALCHAAISASCYDDSSSLDQGWGYTTPHYDPDSGTRNLSYRYKLNSASGNLVNFYLAADSALDKWELNNYTSGPFSFGAKPQRYNGGSTGYYYDPNAIAGQRLGITYQITVGRFVTDPHEGMAYVAQSPTKAAGAESRTAGSIHDKQDLSSYGFGTVHSAEFTFTLQKSSQFYNQVSI